MTTNYLAGLKKENTSLISSGNKITELEINIFLMHITP